MSEANTSEMDFLESELSILGIGEDVVDATLDSVFQEFVSNNAEIIESVEPTDKVLVVVSPLSLKHSYARTWATKRELSTIVERPERLLACSIGVAALFSLSPSRFQLLKSSKQTSLFAKHVIKVHGLKWIQTLTQLCNASESKLANKELEVPENWPTGDIYLNPHTLEALQGVIGSIETAIDRVYSEKLSKAMILVRPPGHHSHTSSPSGFCLVNNAQIAIQYAFQTQQITHAVILDIDLHHGDGTQDLCWKLGGWKVEGLEEDEFDSFEKRPPLEGPKIGYFSIHDINSYPTELGTAYQETVKNASVCLLSHDVCIWNVHLEEYQDMDQFDHLYSYKYRQIITKALEFLQRLEAVTENFKPLVMISAGFDASEYETVKMQRHQVKLPTKFYHNFTSDVCDTFGSQFTNLKVISVLEGGYSDKALCSGVFSHLLGFQNSSWKDHYGSKETVTLLVKGCKSNWRPSSRPLNEWSQQAIKLGRALIPEFVFENDGENEFILDRLRSHNPTS